MELPKRKIVRLAGYDYSTLGYSFITVCTKNKQKMLCDIVGTVGDAGPYDVGKIFTKVSSKFL